MSAPLSWRAVSLIALGVVAATSFPYVIAWSRTPPDRLYLGLKAVNSADHVSFAMWMEQASMDRFWLQDLYTSEPDPRGIAVPFFWVLGLAAHALSLSPFLVLHIARAVAGFLLVLCCYWFTGLFSPTRRARPFLLLALGTGLPGFFPEVSPISSIHDSAQFAASWALLLVAMGLYRQGLQGGSPSQLLGAGLAAGVLAVIHPYDAVTFVAVASVAALLPSARASIGHRLGRLAFSLVLPAAGSAFTVTNILGSPVARAWAGSPRPLSIWTLVSFGALWILAACALALSRRDVDGFLWAWLATGLALVLVPSPLSRKLVQGLQAPLALVAAAGFEALVRAGWGRFARLVEVTIYPASVIMVLLEPLFEPTGIILRPSPLPRAFVEDLRDLRDLGPGVALADPGTSLLIPPFSRQRVHCAHYDMTLDYARKTHDWERLEEGQWGGREVRQAGITYVLVPRSQDLRARGFTLVHAGRLFSVYSPG